MPGPTVADRLTPTGLEAADFATLNAAIDEAVEAADAAGEDTARALAVAVLAALYDAPATTISAFALSPGLLVLAQAHRLVRDLVEAAASARHVDDLADALLPQEATTSARADVERRHFLLHLVGMLSHVRATAGLVAANVDLHLWVRELTRIDRVGSSTAKYLWSDDGAIVAHGAGDASTWEGRTPFPAVYCRHCGRSGWGVGLSPVGLDLDADDTNIRRNHAAREGRFRALLYAPLEADHAFYDKADVEGLRWFSVKQRAILPAPPDDDDPDFRDGWVLPVLSLVGPDADEQSRDDTCPSCLQDDGIRFLGSAIATLLSVTLSTLFNDPHLDAAEKKALVFTDSVQDAAHRAGFVQSRSHTLTLRSVLLDAIGADPVALDELVDEAIRRGRGRRLPPVPARPADAGGPSGVQGVLARRDAAVGAARGPQAGQGPAALRRRDGVRPAVPGRAHPGGDRQRRRRGQRRRRSRGSWSGGAREHPAGHPRRARRDDVRHRDRRVGPRCARTDAGARRDRAPVVRRVHQGGRRPVPDLGRPPQGPGDACVPWRPVGAGVPADRAGAAERRPDARPGHLGAELVRPLDCPHPDRRACSTVPGSRRRCSNASRGTVSCCRSRPPARRPCTPSRTAPSSSPAPAWTYSPRGSACSSATSAATGTPAPRPWSASSTVAHCLLVRCPGRLKRTAQPDNYYRRLYGSGDPRRVVAREHSSLLDDATRIDYETRFKSSQNDPTAPNVLVATPTLEMGIDIGDLSAVMLASLPRTVASYLQRVGRAGRLTGNALNLAFVTGRGEHLPRLGDPLSVIDGEVRPPATYLNAEEILQRQYTAHLCDVLARTTRPHPAPGCRGARQAPGPGQLPR